jgi:pyruvate-ferredoxin/flavodoxin oxidoreductase
MENGVEREGSSAPARKLVPADALFAVAHTEGSIAQRILASSEDTVRGTPGHNVFGETLVVEVISDPSRLARRGLEAAAAGERVAIVATAEELGRARSELAEIAARRLGLVVHVIAERLQGVFSLADLGYGMLFACGVEEASDLTLAARRAAEDCGAPFIVVHERERAGAHIEAIGLLDRELCEVFVGAASSRLRKETDPAHPSHADVTPRAFAERVPFALGSALRELESLTGRRHDTIERFPAAEFQVAFVGVGRVGDSLLAAVERLRASGHDVGAVKITAFRPFGGPRLVKALARAAAVTVLETVDEPLAQSNALTREIKAAFADALTWAPDYPGIGRIPRILSGVVDAGDHELEAHDLDAVLHNMLADERGKRSFVLGPGSAHAIEPASPVPGAAHGKQFTMRGRVADAATARVCAELFAAVLTSTLGLRVRAASRAVPAVEGEGYAFDVTASRERPRGSHAPHAVRLVALDDASALLRKNPLARLADGGVLAIPTSAKTPEALWAELPPYAKALVHDRAARVVGFPAPDSREPALVAAGLLGVALGRASESRHPVDASLLTREVTAALVARGVESSIAARAAEQAARTYESQLEVTRATVERDVEGVALGRRDSRAAPR